MGAFALTPASTFKAPVTIQRAGDEPASVVFLYKHRTRTQLEALLEQIAKGLADGTPLGDVAMIKLVAEGWELQDAFTDENIALLTENYLGSAISVVEAYSRELSKGRVKN